MGSRAVRENTESMAKENKVRMQRRTVESHMNAITLRVADNQNRFFFLENDFALKALSAR